MVVKNKTFLLSKVNFGWRLNTFSALTAKRKTYMYL